MIASIWTHALVAGDRFFGIVFAMKAHVTEKKPGPLLVAVWAFSLIVAAPLVLFKKLHIRQWKNFKEIWCVSASFLNLSLIIFIIHLS